MKIFWTLLLFSVCYVGYLLFVEFLLGNDQLVQLKGKANYRNIIIEKIPIKNQDSIETATFSFRLINNRKQFKLQTDISAIRQGFNIYGGVNKTLSEATEVIVSIRKGEFYNDVPKVYKIEVDDEVIFEIKKKPGERAKVFIGLLLSCMAAVILYFYFSKTIKTSWR